MAAMREVAAMHHIFVAGAQPEALWSRDRATITGNHQGAGQDNRDGIASATDGGAGLRQAALVPVRTTPTLQGKSRSNSPLGERSVAEHL